MFSLRGCVEYHNLNIYSSVITVSLHLYSSHVPLTVCSLHVLCLFSTSLILLCIGWPSSQSCDDWSIPLSMCSVYQSVWLSMHVYVSPCSSLCVSRWSVFESYELYRCIVYYIWRIPPSYKLYKITSHTFIKTLYGIGCLGYYPVF
jgi:hypothetical protein